MLKSKPVSLWIRSVARGKVISSASVLTFQMFSSGLNKHLGWLMKIVSEKGIMRMASDFFHCGKEKKKSTQYHLLLISLKSASLKFSL